MQKILNNNSRSSTEEQNNLKSMIDNAAEAAAAAAADSVAAASGQHVNAYALLAATPLAPTGNLPAATGRARNSSRLTTAQKRTNSQEVGSVPAP